MGAREFHQAGAQLCILPYTRELPDNARTILMAASTHGWNALRVPRFDYDIAYVMGPVKGHLAK